MNWSEIWSQYGIDEELGFFFLGLLLVTIFVLFFHLVTGVLGLNVHADYLTPYNSSWSPIYDFGDVSRAVGREGVTIFGDYLLVFDVEEKGEKNQLVYRRFEITPEGPQEVAHRRVYTASDPDVKFRNVVLTKTGEKLHLAWIFYGAGEQGVFHGVLNSDLDQDDFQPTKMVSGYKMVNDVRLVTGEKNDLYLAYSGTVERTGQDRIGVSRIEAGTETKTWTVTDTQDSIPDLALGVKNDKVVAAWTQTVGHPDFPLLVYQAFSLDGDELTDERQVELEYNKVAQPEVFWGGERWYISWLNMVPDFYARIRGVFVAPLDSQWRMEGEPRLLIPQPRGDLQSYSLLRTEDGFGLVWADFRFNSSAVFTLDFDKGATPTDEVLLLSRRSGMNRNPVLLDCGKGDVFVLWRRQGEQKGHYRLHGRDDRYPVPPPLTARMGLDPVHPLSSFAYQISAGLFNAVVHVFVNIPLLVAAFAVTYLWDRYLVDEITKSTADDSFRYWAVVAVGLGFLATVVLTGKPVFLYQPVFLQRVTYTVPQAVVFVLLPSALTVLMLRRKRYPFRRERYLLALILLLWFFWFSFTVAVPYAFHLH